MSASHGAVTAPIYEPRQIPELAAELASWLASDQALISSAERQFNPDGLTGPAAPNYRTAAYIRSGRLYAVTAEMTGETIAVGEKLTEYSVTETTPPFDSGLVVWHEPVAARVPIYNGFYVSIVAASWGRYGDGFEVRFWAPSAHIIDGLITIEERENGALNTEQRRQLRGMVSSRYPAPLTAVSASVMELARYAEWPTLPLVTHGKTEADDVGRYLVEFTSAMALCERTLVATWTRMGEEVAVETRESADRASCKRIARLDHRLPAEVRVVTLRRPGPEVEQSDAERESRGPLTYRQPVRAHWRNVWLPSEGRHELRKIESYTRGPVDAEERPSTPTVNVLRR